MYMNLEWLKRRPIFGGWRGWLLPICRPTLIIRGSMGGRDMGVQPRCQQPTKTFLKWSEMNLQLKIILEIVGLARIGRIQDLFSEKLRGTPIWSSEFDVPSTIHSGKLHLTMGNDGLHPAGMVARWPGYVSPAAGSLNCSRLGWHGLSAVISCSLGPWKGQKLLSFSDFGMEWNDVPCKRWVCGNWCKFIPSCQVTSSRFFHWKRTETFRGVAETTQDTLVGGLEHFLFSHILGIIIPIDFHIFQRGGPTTNQYWRFQVCSSSHPNGFTVTPGFITARHQHPGCWLWGDPSPRWNFWKLALIWALLLTCLRWFNKGYFIWGVGDKRCI